MVAEPAQDVLEDRFFVNRIVEGVADALVLKLLAGLG